MLLVPRLLAQSTTAGAIGGLVADQSKASVPGATVTVRNVATNAASDAASDVNGRFLVINLAPGVYTVEVTLSGFSPYKRDNVIVEVGRTTTLDVGLGLAGQVETVQVTAESPIINTEQSDFSTNINQTTIANLPTNTRRWSTFALMTPGAAPDGTFGLVSFRGISGLLNNNTVDGGDNTQAFFAEERGRTRLAYSVSADAVREFQVTTSNYSAEYGRAAGGVVNAVTKSGTNEFHGSGFYFLRDNKWGATNPFQTQNVFVDGVSTTVQVKPKDRRQQFGGTVGGPIQKDKVFFFFSYDQQARNFPGVAAPTNPTSVFGPFTAAELATFQTRGITPAQQADGINFLTSLTGVVPRTGDQTLFLPKVDWKLNNSHSLAVTYNRLRWDSPAGVQTAAVVNRGIESWGNDGVNDDWTTARFTSVLGSRMTNEVKFQWGRDFEFQSSQEPAPGEPVSALGRTPQVTLTGAGNFAFGKPDFLERTSYPDERRIDLGDVFTISSGSHYLKIGADISRVSDELDSLFQEAGAYSYSGRADFITDYENMLAGVSTRNYTSFNQGIGPTRFKFHTWDYDVFIQDTWHVNSRTTLNLGLRYDYEKMPEPQIANSLLAATSTFPSDRNNFGPRIGATYDVSGHGSTIIRGGYGLFYGRIINSTISNAITNVGSASGQISLQLQTTSAGAPLPECARERICHAGQARRRGLRRRHAEPDGARVGRHRRTAARCEHDAVGFLRWKRRPQPAALHRREPSPALGHGQLRRDRRTFRWSDDHDADLHRGTTGCELRAHHDGFAPGRLEVQRSRTAGESPAEQGTAVPGQLHRGARDRQRPELADLHLGQQRVESVRARARGRHVELRGPSPVRRQRHLESQSGATRMVPSRRTQQTLSDFGSPTKFSTCPSPSPVAFP